MLAAVLSWPLWLVNTWCWLLGVLVLVVMLVRVVLGPDAAADLHARLAAWLATRFTKQQEAHLHAIKAQLFADLGSVRSARQDADGTLDILEIGVGCGTNLPYYPAGAALTCVDPNPHFDAYFARSCAARAAGRLRTRFVVGRGEQLAVPDRSVDVVVATLVLCSVADVRQVVREVHRALRPGGKFFFLEHISYPEGWWLRRIQDALTHSGIWPCVLQCWLNRDPREIIASQGFQAVDQRCQPIIPSLKPWYPMNLMNRCLYGVATK